MKHYRDHETGEIRHGKPPKHHPVHYHSSKHKKTISKGHVVRFRKYGEEEESTGRITAVGEHGARVKCSKNKDHKILHHEIIEHAGGREAFQGHRNEEINIQKAMIENSIARQHLPALRSMIGLLKGHSSYDHTNKVNGYRIKLEALRNKIVSGRSIPSQDLDNIARIMEQAGRAIQNSKKSKFNLTFRMR